MKLLFLLDCLATLILLPLGRAMLEMTIALRQVPVVEAPAGSPMISVIVPARNEARVIGRCVRSLLAQRYPSFEIIVLDDRSTDATGEVLAELAAADGRLRVLRGQPLPAGWVGKCWAAHQAAAQARGEWLLFVDADTHHQPAALASSLKYAQGNRADLLSLGPHQELQTFWERALLPAIFGIVMTVGGSLDEVNNPRRPLAKASGQFMLFRRQVYQKIGGHESVRDEIVDDFAIARRVKGTGHRLILAGGRDLVATRMYRSFREIWEGFSKNSYFEASRHPAGVLSGLFLPWLVVGVPTWLLGRTAVRSSSARELSSVERAALVQSGAQLLLLLAFGAQLARLLRLPLYWCLAHPPGLLFFSLIMLNSTARVLSGRGVTWKGRRY